MTKHATLKARLHKSLSRTKPTAAPTSTPRPAVAPEGIAQKISVSLHPRDLAAVEGIRAYMARQGHHLTVSQALKLALRTVLPGPDLAAHLAELAADDQRRK